MYFYDNDDRGIIYCKYAIYSIRFIWLQEH